MNNTTNKTNFMKNFLGIFFSWRRSSTIFLLLSLFISFLCFATVILSFWQSVGYNDEAWLLLLIQNQSSALGTSFALYYRFLSDWSVTSIRAFVGFMQLFSWAFLSWAFLRFFRPVYCSKKWEWLILTAFVCVGNNLFWLGGAAPYPNYTQLGSFFAFTGLALLVCGLDDDNGKARLPCLLLSGSFFAQVIFTLPQASIIAPFLLFVLWKKSPRHLLPFVSGGLAGIAFFFLLVQAPNDFLANFKNSVDIAVNSPSNRHGLGMILSGYAKIAITYATVVIPGGFALYGCSKLKNKQASWIKAILILSMAGGFILLTLRSLSWKCLSVPAFAVIYFVILLVYLWLSYAEHYIATPTERLGSWIIFLAILLPTAFCTGTDQGFENRLTSFMPMIFLMILILCFALKDRLAILSMNAMLLLGLCAGGVYLHWSKGWSAPRQTIATKIVGIPTKARVSTTKNDYIQKIILEAGEVKYLATDEFAWDVVFLLQKEPLLLKRFRYYKFTDMAKIITEKNITAGEIAFIESQANALDNDYIDRIMTSLQAKSYKKIALNNNMTLLKFF